MLGCPLHCIRHWDHFRVSNVSNPSLSVTDPARIGDSLVFKKILDKNGAMFKKKVTLFNAIFFGTMV